MTGCRAKTLGLCIAVVFLLSMRSISDSRHYQREENMHKEQRLQCTESHPWRKWINEWNGTTLNKTLNFVHITKTAGTSIEAAAAQVGINWGACHWKHSGAVLNCTADLNKPNIRPNISTHFPFTQSLSLVSPNIGDYWHVPHYFFQENPYAGSTTFAVVRNPYERVLSEFYCPWLGYRGNHPVNVKFMNLWLQRMNMTKNVNETTPINTEHILHNNAQFMNSWLQMSMLNKQSKPIDNGHLLPQHLYIYNDMGKQVVDHVIYYESLDEEFHMLMEKFGLPVVRSNSHVNSRNGTSSLTVENLTTSSIYAINSMYAKDFEMFEYKMVTNLAQFYK